VKSAPFAYVRPDTVEEVLDLLAEHGESAKVLAGGQSLLPLMALRLGRPEVVVDIGRVDELRLLESGPDGTRIGALVRHAEAEFSDDLARYAPLVHQAMPHVGHRAIRNRGTVVGSIAHADASAEMPAVCLATGATMVARSHDGEREIDAGEFFEGYLTNSLTDTELLTEVRFPARRPGEGSAVVEVARRHGDYALAGLACRVLVADGLVTEAALAFFGIDAVPVRVPDAEAVLVGSAASGEAAAEAAAIVREQLRPTADVHGSANYRRHLAGVLTTDGIAGAIDHARDGDHDA
jgi:carbon-monoxide dehydrogenase medium subunit